MSINLWFFNVFEKISPIFSSYGKTQENPLNHPKFAVFPEPKLTPLA